MQLTNEFNDIRQWAKSRGLYQAGDVKTQLVKLQEEVGELSKAVLADNRSEIIDAIGDCVIVLTNLAHLAEQHFGERCTTCRGLVCGNNNQSDEGGSRPLIECKDCGSMDIETCIIKAFNEIKDRVGKMNNGTFVKNK